MRRSGRLTIRWWLRRGSTWARFWRCTSREAASPCTSCSEGNRWSLRQESGTDVRSNRIGRPRKHDNAARQVVAWHASVWPGFDFRSTPRKYAFLPCGHLHFESAIHCTTWRIQGSFYSSYSHSLTSKRSQETQYLASILSYFRYVR